MKGIIRLKGGSGSGNFGHSGRPGHVGGSGSGGGNMNRTGMVGSGSSIPALPDKDYTLDIDPSNYTLNELIDEIFVQYPEIERVALAHNQGFPGFNIPKQIQRVVQDKIKEELGDPVELYHGSTLPLSNNMKLLDNISFTDEFDFEFSGNDGFVAIAKVPVDRIKFYLPWENEFILSGGKLQDMEVDTVKNYFGFDTSDDYDYYD